MKKTFLFKIPVLSILLTGIFMVSSAIGIDAQTTVVGPPPPQGPFMSPPAAIEQLEIEMNALKEAMVGMTQGTYAFKQANAKRAYFEAVRNFIIKGKSVSEAIVLGMAKVPPDECGVTPDDILNYKEEVILILHA